MSDLPDFFVGDDGDVTIGGQPVQAFINSGRKGRDVYALLNQDNTTIDTVQDVFSQAYFDVSRDDDGDIRMRENSMTLFIRMTDGIVLFMSGWRCDPDARDEDKLAYVNAVNRRMYYVRALVTESGSFRFEYSMSLEGGVAPRNLVVTVRNFVREVRDAVEMDTNDLIG